MANVIKHKRSSVSGSAPGPNDLEVGELVINTADGRLFTKKTNGNVAEFARTTDYYTRGEVESLIVLGISRTKRYFFGGNV